MSEIALDETDRLIVNSLQGGLPITARPYRTAARRLGLTEVQLIARLKRLLKIGVLSRFGPLYRIERAGGECLLCAMRVPRERLDEVASAIAAMTEVAHNYEREHAFNLWFVLAAETPERIERARAAIERRTGLPVFVFPKLREYFLDLHLTV